METTQERLLRERLEREAVSKKEENVTKKEGSNGTRKPKRTKSSKS